MSNSKQKKAKKKNSSFSQFFTAKPDMLILDLEWIIKIALFEWPKISMPFDDQNDSVRKLIVLFDVIIGSKFMTIFLFSHFIVSLIQSQPLKNPSDVM